MTVSPTLGLFVLADCAAQDRSRNLNEVMTLRLESEIGLGLVSRIGVAVDVVRNPLRADVKG
jgi:hypothetical protein